MTSQEAVTKLRAIDKELLLLEHTNALLMWDEETYMPEKSIEERSEQVALLQSIIHDRLTSPQVAELLAAAGSSDSNPRGDSALPDETRAFLRALHRKHGREVKLPSKLVTELVRAATIGQAVWREARSRSDFSHFAPQLRELVGLTIRKAECLGFADHPYDALIDEFEPWTTTAQVRSIFAGLEKRLGGLVARIKSARKVEDGFLSADYPEETQAEFSKILLAGMGYDLARGRLDKSAHPFTTTLGRDDVRITARYNRNFVKTGIFSVVHEAGHALYELGFSESIGGSLLAAGTSLGIHESQSRLWENIIGRSEPFWRCYLPQLARLFPSQLEGLSLERFYRGINKVEPSLIRIEADEVTYSLHIILRFDLETRLVAGELGVGDLPEAWNRRMEELFGLLPDSDSSGVLQDIHWSMGSFGYFPTYALGNLYGAQFAAAMRTAIPNLDSEIASGNLRVILEWLRREIHVHGAALTAAELCERVTGQALSPEFFLTYLEQKYAPIYDL